MAEKGYSAAKLAAETGMNRETLRRKLRSGKFGIDEAQKIADVLEIKNPTPIFFTNDVT